MMNTTNIGKLPYEKPEIEVIEFDQADILKKSKETPIGPMSADPSSKSW